MAFGKKTAGSSSMKRIKGHGFGTGTPDKIPKSATFSSKKWPLPDHATASGMSKKKDKGY